ncbi:hypothetical protein BKA62DRAFT_617090 [Auriculariales sp. MPI-PUGE-AT-0066]|nr:hypothetical protein BKA62DRAFT_617090 [Auriculariales sp. MPI-PUGE-AT-0066]
MVTAAFKLLSSDWPPRSSHSIALLAPSHGIVFGGEVQSRTPVPSDVNAFALLPGSNRRLNLGLTGSVPVPRVGATLVQYGEAKYYLWGGRGGTDMEPLEGDNAGLYSFNVSDAAVHWELLSTSGDAPQGRSYHSAAVLGGQLYIHAGCPTKGRLSDLWSFDSSSSSWTRKADAPGDGRGGTALAVARVEVDGQQEEALLRWGGFAGYQLGAGNELDIYLPSKNEWTTVQPSTPDGCPGPRSVHGFAGVNLQGSDDDADNLIAVMFLGERETSVHGHAGAGTFWDDIWGLFQQRGSFLWRKLEVSGKAPSPRGWFAYASVDSSPDERNKIARILLHGGLLSDNKRSGESYVLEVTRRG